VTRAEYAKRPGRSSKWITPCRRLAIYIRDGFRCAYCGRDLSDAAPRELSLDHLVCREAGGDHSNANLVTACYRCNSQRQHKVWFRYATAGALDRIKRLRRRIPNVKLARSILRGETPLVEVLTKQGA
jgi:5-methylcytosine-specific restriction endonuclease McrA